MTDANEPRKMPFGTKIAIGASAAMATAATGGIGAVWGMGVADLISKGPRNEARHAAMAQYEKEHSCPENVPESYYALDMQRIDDGALDAVSRLDSVQAKKIDKKSLGAIFEELYTLFPPHPLGQLEKKELEKQNTTHRDAMLYLGANSGKAARAFGIDQDMLGKMADVYEAEAAKLKAEQEMAIADQRSKKAAEMQAWQSGEYQASDAAAAKTADADETRLNIGFLAGGGAGVILPLAAALYFYHSFKRTQREVASPARR